MRKKNITDDPESSFLCAMHTDGNVTILSLVFDGTNTRPSFLYALFIDFRLQNDGFISHMNVMDNVFIETAVSDGNGLLLRLRDLRMLLQNPPKDRPIKALIVDSITYPFRGQDEEDGKNVTDTIDGLKQRTEILFSISSLLRCVTLKNLCSVCGRRGRRHLLAVMNS